MRTTTSQHIWFKSIPQALLPISEFVLNEKFQRNTSNYAIFYIHENPKLFFPFFILSYLLYIFP